jgi:hypothetical protein
MKTLPLQVSFAPIDEEEDEEIQELQEKFKVDKKKS